MRPLVTLLDHTAKPERIIAMAARLCYTKGMTIADLDQKLTDKKCRDMVLKIVENRHHSCLEHANFTFGIEDVSRNFTHQLVRHRNTSYEQQSLHYLKADIDFKVVQPNLDQLQQLRWNQTKKATFEVYTEMLKEGIPREDARHILPGGIETKIISTANLRQWMHFIKVRSCAVNCSEIQVVAMHIRTEILRLLPFLKAHIGPTCKTDGVCYEGKKFYAICDAHPWESPVRVKGDGLDEVWTKEETL